MDQELDRILDEDYLVGVEALSIADLRAMRGQCQAVETQLSYLRRLVQGRHDIVTSEMDRRDHGGDRYDVASLVERLPQILSDRIHAPGPGRLPSSMEPRELTGRLAARLDAISDRVAIESPGDADDETLVEVSTELGVLEAEVSKQRRQLFDRIDAIQEVITHRYRDGDANVQDLLSGGK